jgi:hypothetical protein
MWACGTCLGEDSMFCEKGDMKINCCLLTCGIYIYHV